MNIKNLPSMQQIGIGEGHDHREAERQVFKYEREQNGNFKPHAVVVFSNI